MTANLLNTLLGLWLTYVAIFPATVGAHFHRWLFGAAIITAGLALWARRGDYARAHAELDTSGDTVERSCEKLLRIARRCLNGMKA